jgi:hypothetical protein
MKLDVVHSTTTQKRSTIPVRNLLRDGTTSEVILGFSFGDSKADDSELVDMIRSRLDTRPVVVDVIR